MRKLFTWIVIIFILLSITTKAHCQFYPYKQKTTFKQYIPSITFTFLAGMSDGLRDAAMYRMDKYGQFWNGKESWLNKYKNRNIHNGPAYFGSTSFLVWTTDGVHLSNLITHQFTGMALVYMPEDNNKRFWHRMLKVAIYNLVDEGGHLLVYDIMFKPTGRD